MGDYLRRWGGPGITTLVGVGFAVIPPIQSYTLAIITFGSAALWAGYLALPKVARFWPGIQRWLPPELLTEQRLAQDAGLDGYFAQMEQWLHGPDAPLSKSPPDERIRISAQERTIGILPGLSPDGKRRVMRFLHRHELITVGTALISLNNADLSRANLAGLRLVGALLMNANLRNADLSGAGLCDYVAAGADMQRMLERGTQQRNFSQPTNISHLSGSNLSGAVLRRTHLAGCKLPRADFAGADLDEADIRGADLRRAENLTQQQIERAYGSKNQEDVWDTQLPGNLKPPKPWEWPLTRQQAMRQSKS